MSEQFVPPWTPGPWGYDGICYIFGPAEEMIADTDDDIHVIRMRGIGAQLPIEANARLIALAPEMADLLLDLETLLSLHTPVSGGDCGCAECDAVRRLRALTAKLIPEKEPK